MRSKEMRVLEKQYPCDSWIEWRRVLIHYKSPTSILNSIVFSLVWPRKVKVPLPLDDAFDQSICRSSWLVAFCIVLVAG
jgi:hypothetical protein